MISLVGVKFNPYFSARSTGSRVRLVIVGIHLSTTTNESGVGLSARAALGCSSTPTAQLFTSILMHLLSFES